ncbi:MAG: CinA family protein [Clostridiales bacterium]|nr:CinA family protein [Clostridiales bacterium]
MAALEGSVGETPAEMIAAARDAGLTIAVAESCTGGLVATLLTEVPGASHVFLGGIVAYADEIKRDLLGVPAATLATHGAVSAQVADAMASGVRKRFGVDIAVSITGIAGPEGGSDEKPVGLVWFAVADAAGTDIVSHTFGGDRHDIRASAARTAIDMLYRRIITDIKQ